MTINEQWEKLLDDLTDGNFHNECCLLKWFAELLEPYDPTIRENILAAIIAGQDKVWDS